MKTIALALLLMLVGCGQPKSDFENYETKILFDKQGRAYLVRHDLSEIYRVERFPSEDAITEDTK